jgi:hypothetical protein
MSTFALMLVAFVASVVGWLATLSLVRDVRRTEFRDFLIAAGGAFCSAAIIMPKLGIAVWGDYGLRFPAVLGMALAAAGALVVANLVRGRGVRCGALRLHRSIMREVA